MEDHHGDRAQRELEFTRVTARLARAIVGSFLVCLAAVPVTEAITGAQSDAGPLAALRQGAPAVTQAFIRARETGAGRASAALASNRETLRVLHDIEESAGNDTWLARGVRGPVQYGLSGWLGAGNEQAYLGSDAWLFYRPDLDYLTAPGFLTPSRLEARTSEGQAWETPPQPDPRAAILHFKRQLDVRGIALVLMVVPGKSAIEPGRFSARYADGAGPLENPSFGGFAADLERAGVIVFDTAREMMAARVPGQPAFLRDDTHWRPEIMEAIAARLAVLLGEETGVALGVAQAYQVETDTVSGPGDIAAMLDLPAGWRFAPHETASIRRVRGVDGTPWRASPGADVLLLGDSFTNIYSLESMGWGGAAGLGEQLSLALGRPVDRVVQNDQGASATRELLARQLAARADRLASTRVVVWQFAARELASGDWRFVELGPPR